MRLVTFVIALSTVLPCWACRATPNPAAVEADTTVAAKAKPVTVSFSKGDGGIARTPLGYGITVNPNTSLTREWITAHDSALPLDFQGTVGVVTAYRSGSAYSGDYYYEAKVPLSASDSLSAFEVRFLLFDIWGNFVRTLSDTEVEDTPSGATPILTPRWRIYSESEVSEHYGSIAFIARVRTKSGRVVQADLDPILAEARKISARFAPEDLEPASPPKRDTTPAQRP